MTPDEFKREYLQEWVPSERDAKIIELAARYHHDTEKYDRTVCTGPIMECVIMPSTPHECGLINRNAAKVRHEVMQDADRNGISRAEMMHAIAKYSGQYLFDESDGSAS